MRISFECSMTESKMGSFLREHPRLMGALFMITLLLTQIGTAAAGMGTTISGP